MAEYADREHFIPIRKSDLIDRLCRDIPPLPAADEQEFRRFCRHLSEHYHLAYYRHLERLKDSYAPFDPDADTIPPESCPEGERAARLERLFLEFDWLLERGNFRKLTDDDLKSAMAQASADGLNLDIEFDAFERLEVYARGQGVGQRSVRRLRNLFRRETMSFPIFQRLVVIVKQQPHKRHETGADFRNVFLKLFKDIPKADIEMLLPAGRLRMPGMQKGKLSASILGTIGFVIYKIVAEINKVFLANPLSFYGPLSLVLGYGYRQYYGYQQVRQSYSLRLARNLYFQNLDNNLGVINRLVDAAEEQECREAVLAYFLLWQSAGGDGLTARELDDAAEGWLARRAAVKVDFEISDALDKLERLRIVEHEGPRFRAVPIETALRRLGEADAAWVIATEPKLGVLNRESA